VAAECAICLTEFVNSDRVSQSYGGCCHIYHEHCITEAVRHARAKGDRHLLCPKCRCLYWLDTAASWRGFNIHREWADSILFHGKCIENRQKRMPPGYFWLRTTLEPDGSRSPPGRIVALLWLDDSIEGEEANDDEQMWLDESATFHHPIKLIWRLPVPVEWTPPRGVQTIFKVPPDLLRRLIRF